MSKRREDGIWEGRNERKNDESGDMAVIKKEYKV